MVFHVLVESLGAAIFYSEIRLQNAEMILEEAFCDVGKCVAVLVEFRDTGLRYLHRGER